MEERRVEERKVEECKVEECNVEEALQDLTSSGERPFRAALRKWKSGPLGPR